MAAPAWTTDLTNIYLDGTATVTALGGGASGLANPETDFYVQGGGTPSSISKQAWTNAIKGFIVDNGANFTVPANGVVVAWGFYSAVASLATKSAGGLRIIVGSGVGDYIHYYVGGSDTLIFESWVPYVIDPNTATADATTGTPAGTERWVGILANLPTTAGPTKGNPIAIDALRYGRHTITYTDGDGAPNYNTFALAEATANSIANRWGSIEFNKGAYFVQGFHSFGSSGTAVDFRDQNKVIFIRASGANNTTNDAVSTAYNRFEILNASSNVDWTNIIFQALGTRARGVFVHTAGTFDAVSCQFIDVDTFSLISTSVMTDCVFRRTNAITAPGSTLNGSQILTPTVVADAGALVWDVNTDPDGLLDGMTFSKGTNDHHAIQFGTNVPATMTLRNCTFTGFSSSDDVNGSVFRFDDTSGSITLNLVGCTTDGAFSVDDAAGVTVTINIDPVTTLVNIKDENGNNEAGVSVYLEAADGTGNLPYQQSITSITRSGTTATVTFAAAHGLKTNEYLKLFGITDKTEDLSGAHQVTVTNSTVLTYQTTDSGSTNYSGTITGTGATIYGTTDANGNISSSRTYTLDQPLRGYARKATTPPYYKSTELVDTVDSVNGLTLNRRLVLDQ